jgi:hypothetical protein
MWVTQSNCLAGKSKTPFSAPTISGSRSEWDFFGEDAAVGFFFWLGIVMGLALCLVVLAWMWIPLTGKDS